MIDSWYSWFPGMDIENEKKNDLLRPVAYQVELTFHSKKTLEEVGKINTSITWYMGRIICTGILPEDSIMVDVVTEIIQNNENQSIKAASVREYSPDFDIMIFLERSVLCTSKENN